MAGFKTIFIRRGSRVIPIRKSLSGEPDELQKIVHLKRAQKNIKKQFTKAGTFERKYQEVFFKKAKKQSKEAGKSIAKRIARLKRLKK